MMGTRALDSPPRLAPLFARSAASMLPGASLLPFVPGRGREMPDTALLLAGVHAEPARVAAYAKVCGFTLRHELPITYPHVLAFPLHMALMADGAFPFGAVGLVHVENRIVQRSRIPIGQELSIRVTAGVIERHQRGRTFTLHTEVSSNGEVVWEGFSTMLRRGGDSDETRITRDTDDAPEVGNDARKAGKHAREAGDDARDSGEHAPEAGKHAPEAGDTRETGTRITRDTREKTTTETAATRLRHADLSELPAVATWRLPGDLGRRYAAVSGDSNPIHMHPLSAKLFGFPGAIAHGMWSKARCLAALESRLPEACEVRVRFRKPIVLPARVVLECSPPADAQPLRFALADAKRGLPHLDGSVTPLESAVA